MRSLDAVGTRAAARADRAGLRSLRGACLALALVVFVSFAALVVYGGVVHAGRERDRVRRDVLTQARTLANHVETHLATRLDALAGLAEAAGRGSQGAIEAQLRLLQRSYADLAPVLVVDGRGAVLASTGPGGEGPRLRDPDLWRRGASGGRALIGEPRRSGADVVVGLYVPARAPDGQVPAGVVAELSLRPVLGLLGRVGLGAGTVAEILTPSGFMVAREPARAESREPRSAPRYRDLLRSEQGSEVVFEDGVRRLVGAAVIRPAGWVVAMGHPVTRVRTNAWTPLVLAVSGAVAALGLALVLALPVVRRTSDGLDRLRTAMRRLEVGDIPANLPVTVGGEVGALTEGFNRLLSWLRDRLGEYKALSHVEEAASAAIAGDRPLAEVPSDLLRNMVRGMNAEVGVLILREPEGLVARAAVGLWGVPVEGVVLRRGHQGLAGAVVEKRRVTLVPDTEADDLADEPYIQSAGLRSVVAAPMVSRGEVIGVVEIGYRAPHTFSVGEVQRLEAMVRRTVQAFEHAQALEVAPDLATRVGILKRRAALDGVALSDDLASYMAGEVTGSIRDVESYLTRILAFSDLTGRELGRELVEEFLVNIWRPEGHGPADAGDRARPPFLAVVRRGATELFETFKQYFGPSGPVEVVWDRRLRPRRSGRQVAVPERRRGDRRREPGLGPNARNYVLIRRHKP